MIFLDLVWAIRFVFANVFWNLELYSGAMPRPFVLYDYTYSYATIIDAPLSFHLFRGFVRVCVFLFFWYANQIFCFWETTRRRVMMCLALKLNSQEKKNCFLSSSSFW